MTFNNSEKVTASLVNVGLIAQADEQAFDDLDHESIKDLADKTTDPEFAVLISQIVNASCGTDNGKPGNRLDSRFETSLTSLLNLTPQSQLGIVELLVYSRRTAKGWR